MLKRQRQMKTLRSLAFVLVPVLAIFVVISLVNSGDDSSKASTSGLTGANCAESAKPVKTPTRKFSSAPPVTIDAETVYTATMCTSKGEMTLQLDPKTAPVATNNFVYLAKQGFYDGLPFHRAATDFVIQGGDPNGDGSGGPGYTVVGEVPTDHYPVGSLAAAKSGADPAGTFGSQFFIVTGSKGATLPNDYARFGTLTKGLDVAKAIDALAPASGDGNPTKDVKIVSVAISESPATAASSTTTTTAGK